MNDNLRTIIQLAVNILGVGFVIIVGFSQLGDFFADRKPRHLCAALAWFVLVPVLVLRTANVVKPPLLDPQTIADGAAIGWGIVLVMGICWGILRLLERRREHDALRRISAEVVAERENERVE